MKTIFSPISDFVEGFFFSLLLPHRAGTRPAPTSRAVREPPLLLTPHSSLLTSFLLLLLLLQGCSTSSHQTWYKDGGTQREFDLDARDCEVIAEQQALLQSENGRRYDPLTYADLYQRCITAKGWNTAPPRTEGQPEKEPLPAPALGVYADNRLAAFGIDFTLPEDAQLLSEKRQTVGPTHLDSFMFRTGGNFMNFILQESEEATFNPIDYPVSPPYQLYTAAAQSKLRWAAFWGEINGEWVKGMGAFFTVSKQQRTIVVITAAMAAPAETPPEDLHLARNQYQEMESFIREWQPWLEKQAPRESVVIRGVKSAFDMLKSF
ncbi:MAG: hypothetical protein AB1461_17040 [Thermodesulfobacteriota bacterium]